MNIKCLCALFRCVVHSTLWQEFFSPDINTHMVHSEYCLVLIFSKSDAQCDKQNNLEQKTFALNEGVLLRFAPQMKAWSFMRTRPDKETPNHISTFEKARMLFALVFLYSMFSQ